MPENNEQIEYYDLHCHFLPGMDDGCQSAEESFKLLQEQYRQGARGVAATPHYYATESIMSFLERREQAARRLAVYLKQKMAEVYSRTVTETQNRQEDPDNRENRQGRLRLPAMVFGAEVAFRETLVNERELERLCLGKSRYLLLEMPFTPWTDRTVRGVEQLANSWGITPIIAHIERYTDIAEEDLIDALIHTDVLVQLNAGNFGSRKSEKNAIRRIREGEISVLGTDAHNMERRPPNMELAIKSLIRHRMGNALEELLQNNAMVFHAAQGV